MIINELSYNPSGDFILRFDYNPVIAGVEIDFANNLYTRIDHLSDNFDGILPWSGMRRCTIQDGVVTSYLGDTNYIEDGSLGDVMVEIPKFYYQMNALQTETNPSGDGLQLVKGQWRVSSEPVSGFKVHPAFVRNGIEVNHIYISAYEGSLYDVSESSFIMDDAQVADFTTDKLVSIVGAKPISGLTQNLTIGNAELLATNKGEGYLQFDFTMASALQLLMLIEYCTFDTQSKLGRGYVDITDDGSSNMSTLTGGCASCNNDSGYLGVTGKSSVCYRGIENPYGNIWKWVSGLNIEAKGIHKAYWSNDNKTVNTSDGHTAIGFSLCKSSGYLSRIGYDKDNDFVFLPTSVVSSHSTNTPDYFYQNNTHDGWLVAQLGTPWYTGSYAGVFCWYLHISSGYRARAIGARFAFFTSNDTSTINSDIIINNEVKLSTNVVPGSNSYRLSTLSNTNNCNQLKITNKIGSIDNLMVVAVEDENTEFGYFEGIKSSYECEKMPESLVPEGSTATTTCTNAGTPEVSNSGYIHLPKTLPIGSLATVVCNVTDLTENSPFGVFGYDATGNGVYYDSKTLVKGYNIIIIPIKAYSLCKIGVATRWTNKIGDTCTIEDIMVFEGDWSHLSIDELREHAGQYKVDYKVVGKNLFNVHGNINEYYFSSIDDFGKGYNHQLLDGGIIKVIARSWNHRPRGQKIKVKNNTNYTVKFGKVENVNHKWGIKLSIRTLEDEVIHTVYNINTNHAKIVFNSLNNDYIYFAFAMDGNQDDTMYSLVSNIQLEEGTTATEYEPYKESTKTIYLNSPLLEGDELRVQDGWIGHYHKMGKVVLDGSENWIYGYTSGNYALTTMRIDNVYNSDDYLTLDHFVASDTLPIATITDSSVLRLGIGIHKSQIRIRLTENDANGSVKQWLAENPTTIVYEIANPYFEPLVQANALSLDVFNTNSTVSTNSIVPISQASITNLGYELIGYSTPYTLDYKVKDGTKDDLVVNIKDNRLYFHSDNEAKVSDVVLVDGTDTKLTGEYFEGMMSTYECTQVIDESDENYGKYQVDITTHDTNILFGKGGRL